MPKPWSFPESRRTTPNPPGGDFLRDASGNPTGLFRETASRLIRTGAGEPPRTPEEETARARRILELASQEAVSKGVTTFQDAGSGFATVDLLKKMIDEGRINVRLWIMLNANNEALAANLENYRTIDYNDGFLTVRAIKRQIDGALGPRGAWLLEPYSDKPDDIGRNTTPLADIRETAKLAMKYGYQLCVHAIGDRANRETLNIFDEAFKANPDKKDVRWRIEHAQHLHPADIPRFGKLGVIASMQGVHATSDAPYVPARLGAKRAQEGAYVWQKLMKSGAVVTNGTDAPVEDLDPIAGYYATVSRKTKDGTVFNGAERMSRMEALRSYTINGAYAAFEEDTRGTLKPGKYADLVVLSKDILTIPEDDIPSAEVRYTIVGGKIRYKKAPMNPRNRPALKGGPTEWLSGSHRLTRRAFRGHLAAILILEAVARTVEALGERTAGFSGHRAEPAPRRLRLTHLFSHLAPFRFFAGPPADGIGGERFTQHLSQRLR